MRPGVSAGLGGDLPDVHYLHDRFEQPFLDVRSNVVSVPASGPCDSRVRQTITY